MREPMPPRAPAPRTPGRHALGRRAEGLAAQYLRARGLIVLARNLRCRRGELDLVCSDRDVLVVVEVRTRSRADFGGALASVDGRKQRRLLRAAAILLAHRPGWRDRRLRFDVIAVHDAASATPRFEWIVDAFRGG